MRPFTIHYKTILYYMPWKNVSPWIIYIRTNETDALNIVLSFNLHTLGILNASQPNGLAVPDATLHPVNSTSDVVQLMRMGLANRAVGLTALNERSSRSHRLIFMLAVNVFFVVILKPGLIWLILQCCYHTHSRCRFENWSYFAWCTTSRWSCWEWESGTFCCYRW